MTKVKTSKYPSKEGSFPSALLNKLQNYEVPVYASQGLDVGKVRGRKSKKMEATKSPSKKPCKTRKGKGKKKNTRAKQRTAKAKAMERYKAEHGNSNEPTKPKPNKTALAKTTQAEPSQPKRRKQATSGSTEQQSKQNNKKERIPPEHVTANHVYSSAYRKAKAQGMDGDQCRKIAMQAGQLFRERGVVTNLCGEFRSTRRKDFEATQKGALGK